MLQPYTSSKKNAKDEKERQGRFPNLSITQIQICAASLHIFTSEKKSNFLYKYANNALMGNYC